MGDRQEQKEGGSLALPSSRYLACCVAVSCRSTVGQAGVTGVPPATGRGRFLTAAFDNYKRLLRKALSLRSCQQDQACLR